MTPEYGSTAGMFAVDDAPWIPAADRPRPDLVALVEAYHRWQGTFGDREGAAFARTVDIDLAAVEPVLAGPSRPEQTVSLRRSRVLRSSRAAGNGAETGRRSVAIAAITSCTNTSNPSLMMAAGLVAKKAVEHGLRPTSRGSRRAWRRARASVTDVPRRGRADCRTWRRCGFHLVGYGCAHLHRQQRPAAGRGRRRDLRGRPSVAAVLAATATSRGASTPQVRANYLASPPLVVAYALAGGVDTDLTSQPVGSDRDGNPVISDELWPTAGRGRARRGRRRRSPSSSPASTVDIFDGDERWRALPVPTGELFEWDPDSTYVREPPSSSARRRSVRHRGRAGAGDPGRLGHDRPHLSGRVDRVVHARRSLPGRARRRASGRVRQLRRAPRQPRGDGARHLREHPAAQRARRPASRAAPPGTSPTARCCRSSTRRCATRPTECRWWSSPARSTGSGSSRDWAAKGPRAARRAGRHRRELRAHPPQQPGRAGRAAAAVPGGRLRPSRWASPAPRRSRSTAWASSRWPAR